MRHKAFARGVSTLMFIGDTPTAPEKPTNNEIAAGAIAAIVAFKSKGLVRLAAAGIATWVGYKAIKSQ